MGRFRPEASRGVKLAARTNESRLGANAHHTIGQSTRSTQTTGCIRVEWERVRGQKGHSTRFVHVLARKRLENAGPGARHTKRGSGNCGPEGPGNTRRSAADLHALHIPPCAAELTMLSSTKGKKKGKKKEKGVPGGRNRRWQRKGPVIVGPQRKNRSATTARWRKGAELS